MRSTRRHVLFSSALVPFLSRFSSGKNSQALSDTASIFNKHMDWMEQQFVPAAEAMPEDKFFWALTSGELQLGGQPHAPEGLWISRIRVLEHGVCREFTPVFAKHLRSFRLIDSLAIGVDRMKRNFGPMQKKGRKGGALERRELTVVTAGVDDFQLGDQPGTTPFVNTSAVPSADLVKLPTTLGLLARNHSGLPIPHAELIATAHL